MEHKSKAVHKRCQSDNIEERVWVNINTQEVTTSCEDERFFCQECDEEFSISEIETIPIIQ